MGDIIAQTSLEQMLYWLCSAECGHRSDTGSVKIDSLETGLLVRGVVVHSRCEE